MLKRLLPYRSVPLRLHPAGSCIPNKPHPSASRTPCAFCQSWCARTAAAVPSCACSGAARDSVGAATAACCARTKAAPRPRKSVGRDLASRRIAAG
eukprot:3534697-Pleurochrysis_carterae.AAC.3